MKCGAKRLVFVAGSLVLAIGTRAAVNENNADASNPFSAIVERNVFALKDPPPPPQLEVKTNTPPPNIRLTGITTIFGTSNKRALFMVQEIGIPGKPASKEESYILTEGQRQGAIEVLEIDEKKNSVKIKNDGNEAVLTLDEKVKLPSAPAIPGFGAPLPGGAPPPGGLPRLPTFAPTAGVTPAGSISPVNPQPATPVSFYGNNNAAAPAANSIALNNGTANVELPLRTIRTPPTAAPVTGPVPSPEEQIIMIEAQREANKNNPRFPPLPPTPLTPVLQGEQNQQPEAPPAP
jgi:hypothetical protein